jgi:hypothetical protein
MNLGRALPVILLLACSPSDDGTGPANDIDPEWPPDEALPAEFDLPPWLNMPLPGVIEVSWGTPEDSLGTVRYGHKGPDQYETELYTDAWLRVHHILLEGLRPGTAYWYEVAIDGTSAVRKGVFVTPGREDYRFLHFGEFHAPSESANVARYAPHIQAFRPHVIVESGDMVDDGGRYSEWREYFQVSASWISNVILLPALSNHVNGTGDVTLYSELFCLPNNERWYSSRIGPIQFMSIDSTFDEMADIETDEMAWLAAENALAHDGEDDPLFVIGAWHYPACSSNYRERAPERAWVNTNIVQTFRDTGGLDLILVGHDKYYERSEMTGGIVHLMANVGKVSPDVAGNNAEGCTPLMTKTDGQSLALFELIDGTLSARVIDPLGGEIDSFVMSK